MCQYGLLACGLRFLAGRLADVGVKHWFGVPGERQQQVPDALLYAYGCSATPRCAPQQFRHLLV